jgi:lipid A oxidase
MSIDVEWVLAAYLGAAHTQSAPISIVQPTLGTAVAFERVAYEDHSFAQPVYYGYRVSYFPSSAAPFGIEAEMIHLKVYAQTSRITYASGTHRHRTLNTAVPISDVVQRFSISHGLNLLLANMAVRRTILHRGNREPRVQVIARLGAGPTFPHPETTVDGVSHEGYELGAIAFQASGGVELRLSSGLAIGGEYKFTRTFQSMAIDRGNGRGAFASHHGVFGVAWHSKR